MNTYIFLHNVQILHYNIRIEYSTIEDICAYRNIPKPFKPCINDQDCSTLHEL